MKYLERYFMLRNCNSLDLRMLPPVGIELRPWEETNLDDAAQLTVHAYENIVDREISIHYESFDGCRNYLRNIISKLGCGSFVKNASFCALHLHSKQWIGFVLTSSVSSFNGQIPQVVVSPVFQGRGIGTHLLIRSIVALSTQQYRTISLSVTAKNKGAVTLYQRLNFNTLIRFHAAAWSRCGPG
ncbi:MAG: hypothetical protein DMG05_04220 [Acidobacteria bacterium]|nr:MAG: hypothetical protein DMG05_04220 [Acidobacteriota bacterium]